MTSTQQSEAQQAVRLLYKYAIKGIEGHEPEALYQARVLLEGFIKSAGVLESAEDKTEYSLYHGNAVYKVGDKVLVRGGIEGEIVGFMIAIDTPTSKYAGYHPSQTYQIAGADISTKYANTRDSAEESK
jgi:hypothetical protein